MALIDDTVSVINASLLANLSWLDNAYGKIERKTRKDASGRDIDYPGVFDPNTNKEHINLLPDRKLGNYSYFDVADGSDYEVINKHVRPIFLCRVVFWFHWPDLYPSDWQGRSIEQVKAQILNVLMWTNPGNTVTIFNIYEDADNIYRGFSHNEIERQFLMRPYGGLAFECKMWPGAACNLTLPIPTIPANLFGTIPTNYSETEQVWPYEKWFGQKIYWRTWIIGDGIDDYVTLTGFAIGFTRIRSEYRAVIGGNQVESNASIEVGTTDYKVLTTMQESAISATAWYIK